MEPKFLHLDAAKMDSDSKSTMIAAILCGAVTQRGSGATLCVPVSRMLAPPPAVAPLVTQKFCSECHEPVYVTLGGQAKSYICLDCASKSGDDVGILKPTCESMADSFEKIVNRMAAEGVDCTKPPKGEGRETS
jgi:hypothetical protein